MLRKALIRFAAFAAFAAPAGAACVGANLFDLMPAAQQQKLTAAAQAVPWAEGLEFRATKGDARITLVGTYHLPDARFDAMVSDLRPELMAAKTLLVEMGPKEEAAYKNAVATRPELMFITKGPTIPEMLPEADWQRLMTAVEARGVPSVLAAKMKPSYLSMMLALPPCAGPELAKGEAGLDERLMQEAEKDGIPIEAVEPWDTVFALFDQLAPADDVGLLRSALIDANDSPDAAATMGDLYFARKPRLIWEISKVWAQQSDMPEDEIDRQLQLTDDLLMTGRNRAWLPVIERAADTGPVMVAVGALHLSGENGLLELLRGQGWTIARLD